MLTSMHDERWNFMVGTMMMLFDTCKTASKINSCWCCKQTNKWCMGMYVSAVCILL